MGNRPQVKISALALLKMVRERFYLLLRSAHAFFSSVSPGRTGRTGLLANLVSGHLPSAYISLSASTCCEQAMHARSGGQIEVMGILQVLALASAGRGGDKNRAVNSTYVQHVYQCSWLRACMY